MLAGSLHEHYLLRYDVELEDKPASGLERIATVTFFDEHHRKINVYKFAVVEPEEIYRSIEKGEASNLDNCYVKDFSLSDYRRGRGFDDNARVVLKDFTARKAFFDCDVETDFSHAEFTGDKVTFESSVFGNGTVNFFKAGFAPEVVFKKVKFGSGSTTFRSAQFGAGAANFHNVNFGTGDLDFADANFKSASVDFKNAIFSEGDIDFKFAKFSRGSITFERADFGTGKKNFKNVEFGGGNIDFRRVDFGDGDISFEGAEFGEGKISFRSSVFGKGFKSFEQVDFATGNANFDLVDFGSGSVSFNNAKADEISFKGCSINSYADLRFRECSMLDLSSTIVRDILDIKPEEEKGVIKKMRLVDMRILGRIFVDWRGNHVHKLIYGQEDTSVFQKAEQFRILKENFRINGQYADEDAAYLEFKRCEAKANLKNAISESKINAVWAYPNYYFQKYVFDFIGRYATAPTRVLANVFVTVAVFGVFYFFITTFFPGWGHVASTLPAELNHSGEFWNCIYYSAITFFTIGYGDYFANGYLKIFAVMEGFTGVFFMSYFTVAFVRKILR